MPVERSEDGCSEELPTDPRTPTDVWVSQLPRLRGLARGLNVSSTDIEDILQEVSLQTLEKCPADWNVGQVTGWLYRVTINRCHLLHRQNQRQSQAYRNLATQSLVDPSLGDQEAHTSGSQPLIHAEQKQLVEEQMVQLPPALQEVLVLKYFADFNAQQIADLLQIPHATVRTRLRQARLRLAAALENTGFEYE